MRIGFVIPKKENEKRRALLPKFVLNGNRSNKSIYVEENYGLPLGINNDEYSKLGINVVTRKRIFEDCKVICDLKIDSARDKDLFQKGQIGFGWFHAIQGREITDLCIEKEITAIAWEEMYEKNKHTFWQNNYIAGKAAAIDIMRFIGKTLDELNIAIIGRGNTALGVLDIVNKFSSRVDVFNHSTIQLLREEIHRFDVIFNCVLWDPLRKDRILYKEDIRRMKPNSTIVDISCNHRLEIETSYPTTIENPTYYEEGVLHYVVDHTPSIFFREASDSISSQLQKFLYCITDDINNETLEKATIIKEGVIIDERIVEFQRRKEI